MTDFEKFMTAFSITIIPILIIIASYISYDDLSPENIKERIAKESSASIVYIDEGKVFKYDDTYYLETSDGRTFRIEGYKE